MRTTDWKYKMHSSNRAFDFAEVLVEIWTGGSHIDVFDRSINLCTSVARIIPTQWRWKTKKWFHQKWREMRENARSISIGNFLGCAERPCFHQPPRQLAPLLCHNTALLRTIQYHLVMLSSQSGYTSNWCRSSVRPVDAGRVRISLPNHLSDCRGPPRAATEPCELY
jgi:hypothetical protein